MRLEVDGIRKPRLGECRLAQHNLTGFISCTKVFNIRAQPVCTEIYRIASPAECCVFIYDLGFRQFYRGLSSPVGETLEHNTLPKCMDDGSPRQACVKSLAQCSTSRHLIAISVSYPVCCRLSSASSN